MNDSSDLPPEFAAPQRADADEVHDQSQIFRANPLLRDALDAVPNIVMILNAQQQIVFANHALLEAVVMTDEERLLGLRPGEALSCVHSDEAAGGCGATESCRTCGAMKAILSSLSGHKAVEECRITRKDGSSLDLSISGRPLVVGDATFSVFAVQDISAAKRRQALEQIFFHDVVNSAGVLIGYLDLMQDPTVTPSSTIMKEVFEASLRLIEEIETQRDLIAAENLQLVTRAEVVSLLSLVEDLVGSYRHHPVAEGRKLRVMQPEAATRFETDPVLLRRVIGNMLKNALEATPEGGTVTIWAGADDGGLAIEVHNPTVMPRDVQLQVFQRSFSTKGSNRGLGTYSMKLLTEQYLRGRVSFTSTPDGGTTFRVWYPQALTQS